MIFTSILIDFGGPKRGPKSSQNRPPEASRWPQMSFKSASRCLFDFHIDFNRFWGPQNGSKMVPQIAQKSPSGPKGRQEASGEPSGWHFKHFWTSFWHPSGPNFRGFYGSKNEAGVFSSGVLGFRSGVFSSGGLWLFGLASLALASYASPSALGSWALALPFFRSDGTTGRRSHGATERRRAAREGGRFSI